MVHVALGALALLLSAPSHAPKKKAPAFQRLHIAPGSAKQLKRLPLPRRAKKLTPEFSPPPINPASVPTRKFDLANSGGSSLPLYVAQAQAMSMDGDSAWIGVAAEGMVYLSPPREWLAGADLELECTGEFRHRDMRVRLLTQTPAHTWLEHGSVTTKALQTVRVFLETSRLNSGSEPAYILLSRAPNATRRSSFKLRSCKATRVPAP